MQQIWEERYQTKEYIYGKEPNDFFAQSLKNIKDKGRILLPAEGEGRNAIYAASLGWKVDAFDYSHFAKEKAIGLCKEKNVSINYQIGDIKDIDLPENYYHCIALIYHHLEPELRKLAHQKYIKSLAKKGTIILEAFDIEQIKNTSGGPKNETLLFTEEILMQDFALLNIKTLEKCNIHLDEGMLHKGNAIVWRMIAEKL